jgi:hypothetical protein
MTNLCGLRGGNTIKPCSLLQLHLLQLCMARGLLLQLVRCNRSGSSIFSSTRAWHPSLLHHQQIQIAFATSQCLYLVLALNLVLQVPLLVLLHLQLSCKPKAAAGATAMTAEQQPALDSS